MQYKVVPFTASVASKEGSQTAASQLEKLCNDMATEGWEYLQLENVETYVEGSAGCFGIGAKPPVVTSFSMAVFKK